VKELMKNQNMGEKELWEGKEGGVSEGAEHVSWNGGKREGGKIGEAGGY